MSLVHCPECGHEVATTAVACPNCGRPVQAPPVVDRKVVVAQPIRREHGVPPWAFAAMGIVGVLILFVIYFAVKSSDDQDNTNINVNVAGRRTTTVPASDSTTVSVPPSSDTQIVTVPAPQTSAPSTTTTVPGTETSAPIAPPPVIGTVVINAKVMPSRGGEVAVRNARFYLLDKDIETILREARLEPIEGNSLTGSLGLAVVFPERYGDFSRAAMRAIGNHSKYSGTTSGTGAANLKGVTPDGYYLFGITKVGNGFAMWNSPVSIVAGENVMNLSPQRVTEIPES